MFSESAQYYDLIYSQFKDYEKECAKIHSLIKRIHPEANATQLQQLIVSARKELSEQQPPRAARKLFKYLRELMQG